MDLLEVDRLASPCRTLLVRLVLTRVVHDGLPIDLLTLGGWTVITSGRRGLRIRLSSRLLTSLINWFALVRSLVWFLCHCFQLTLVRQLSVSTEL